MPDLLICPKCGMEFGTNGAATNHAVNRHALDMPATYDVVISGMIDLGVAEMLADTFRHSPNKPGSITVSVNKVWWP